MADLLDTDQFLINRSNSTQTVEQADLMAELLDTDLMLINRSNQTYTITGEDLKESIGPGPIEFTPTISGNNEVGDVLTANAGAITGGVAPVEYAFQWKRGIDEIAGATSKTYTLVSADVGQTISCELIVAEPDGTDGVLETAIYDQIPEQGIAIVTPTIIAPPDGAGVGGDTTYTPKTSAITNVDTINDAWTSASATEANQWTSVTYGNGKFVAVAGDGTNRVMYSDDGISWTAASATEANRWDSVTFGGPFNAEKFVAVSTNGTNRVMYSDDGITWTSASATEGNNWCSVTYGNGKWVAVSFNGTNQVMYSTNGSSWTPASAAENNSWKSVTYGGGKFVAVANDGTSRVMHSPDGVNWTAATAAEANPWYYVTYGNGKFVAGALDGTVMYSTDDGISWTSASTTATEDNSWYGLTYGNGKFVAVSGFGTNRVMYSDDGISWTSASAEYSSWMSVTYGDGKFVAVAQTGTNRVMWSPNGTGINSAALTFTDANTYDADTGANMGQPISETFTAGQTVTGVKAGSDTAAGTLTADASGNTMTVEPAEPLAFTTVSDASVAEGNWVSIAYGEGVYVAVSSSGSQTLMYSTDNGITWETPSIISAGWTDITYGNSNGVGRFVAVGNQGSPGTGKAMYCEAGDPTYWQACVIPKDSMWGKVAWGNNQYVALAGSTNPSESIMYSSDGETWSDVGATGPENKAWNTICYGDGKKWVVGTNNKFAYSDDGISNWTAGIQSSTTNTTAIAYGNNKYVAVSNLESYPEGTLGFPYSDDGITWEYSPVQTAPREAWRDVTFADGKFVAVASSGDDRVMSSEDGITWTPSKASKDADWNGIASGEGKLVAVGGSPPSAMTAFSSVGPFVDGMEVVNSTTATQTAPSADDLEFVGSTPASDPLGSINAWGDATWEVSTDSAFTAPMVGTKIITPGSNQTLAPAERGAIVLDGDTEYWAQLSYNATDPSLPNVTSSAVHFKTADNSVTIDDVFYIDIYSGGTFPQNRNPGFDYLAGALLWTKCLNVTFDNSLVNHLSPTDFLSSNNTKASLPTQGELTLTNSGYDLGNWQGKPGIWNNDSCDYVSYSFKAAPTFFDVVKYTGNADVNQTIPHGLTTIPGCIIVKNIDDLLHWNVYHKEAGTNKYGWLDEPNAFQDSVSNQDCWTPTAESFTANEGSIFPPNNANGKEYIAYLFADTPGLIKCGVSADVGGARDEVNLGFKPAFVLTKNVDANASWIMVDIKRGIPFNPIDAPHLYANSNDKESSTYATVNMNSTEDGIIMPAGPGRFIYIAIAKGGTTRFFDTEAFQAITDNEVIARYGVDPYTTNLEPLGIQRLMEEPVGVTAGYALCEGTDTLCPVQDLTNVVGGLENEVEKVAARNALLRQYVAADLIAEAQALIAQWATEDGTTPEETEEEEAEEPSGY